MERVKMMEKIIVTKRVANALEILVEMCQHNRVAAVDEYFEMRYEWEHHESDELKELTVLTELGTDNFIKALYYGYEVE